MKTFLCLIPFLLFGCSLIESSQEATTSTSFRSLELYLARANLADADFEHYKIFGDHLFAECGKVHRGKSFPEQHSLNNISPEQRKEVESGLTPLIEVLNGKNPDFADPGTLSSLFDPGQINLILDDGDSPRKIRTSLDSISEPTGKHERALAKLVKEVRQTGGDLCKFGDFYGLGK